MKATIWDLLFIPAVTASHLCASMQDRKLVCPFYRSAAGQQVTVKRDGTVLSYKSPLMDIDYINSPQGLRQNFTVHKKRPGAGNLSITIKVATALHTEVDAGKDWY